MVCCWRGVLCPMCRVCEYVYPSLPPSLRLPPSLPPSLSLLPSLLLSPSLSSLLLSLQLSLSSTPPLLRLSLSLPLSRCKSARLFCPLTPRCPSLLSLFFLLPSLASLSRALSGCFVSVGWFTLRQPSGPNVSILHCTVAVVAVVVVLQ